MQRLSQREENSDLMIVQQELLQVATTEQFNNSPKDRQAQPSQVSTVQRDTTLQLHDTELLIDNNELKPNCLRQSNFSQHRLSSFAQTEEYDSLVQGRNQNAIVRLSSLGCSLNPKEARDKAIFGVATQKNISKPNQYNRSQFVTSCVAGQYQEINTESRLGHHYLGSAQKRSSTPYSDCMKNQITSDCLPQGHYDIEPMINDKSQGQMSTRKLEAYNLDATGITAARRKRDYVLKMYNRKEGVLKTKQFRMLMPEPRMNTEDLIYASQEQKDASLRRADRIKADQTLQPVREDSEIKLKMEDHDLKYLEADTPSGGTRSFMNYSFASPSQHNPIQVTAEHLFHFDPMTKQRFKKILNHALHSNNKSASPTRMINEQQPLHAILPNRLGGTPSNDSQSHQKYFAQGQTLNAFNTVEQSLDSSPRADHRKLTNPNLIMKDFDDSAQELNAQNQNMQRVSVKTKQGMLSSPRQDPPFPSRESMEQISTKVLGDKNATEKSNTDVQSQRELKLSIDDGPIKGEKEQLNTRLKSDVLIVRKNEKNFAEFEKEKIANKQRVSEDFVDAQSDFLNIDLKGVQPPDDSLQTIRAQNTYDVKQQNEYFKNEEYPEIEIISGNSVLLISDYAAPSLNPKKVASKNQITIRSVKDQQLSLGLTEKDECSPHTVFDDMKHPHSGKNSVEKSTMLVNIPDSANQNTIKMKDEDQQDGNIKLRQIQKLIESKTGRQQFSPRTTKPPQVKKLNKRMFKTLQTRHFNNQVMQRKPELCIDEQARSQTSNDGLRSQSPRQQYVARYFVADSAPAANNSSLAARMPSDSRRTHMARITGAMSKTLNCQSRRNETSDTQKHQQQQESVLQPSQNAETSMMQHKNTHSSIRRSFMLGNQSAELSPIFDYQVAPSFDKNNKVSVDFKTVQTGMESESSHHSLNKEFGFRLSYKDSARSKSSVTHDFNKYTEDEIRRSLEEIQKDINRSKDIKQQTLHRLNIFFKDHIKISNMETDDCYSRTMTPITTSKMTNTKQTRNTQQQHQTTSKAKILLQPSKSYQKTAVPSITKNNTINMTVTALKSSQDPSRVISTQEKTENDMPSESRPVLKPQYGTPNGNASNNDQTQQDNGTPELGKYSNDKQWEEVFKKLSIAGNSKQSIHQNTEPNQIIPRKQLKKKFTAARRDTENASKQTDKGTFLHSNQDYQYEQIASQANQWPSRFRAKEAHRKINSQPAQPHKATKSTNVQEQMKALKINEFSMSKVCTVSNSGSSQYSAQEGTQNLDNRLDQPEYSGMSLKKPKSMIKTANVQMLNQNPSALKKLKSALDNKMQQQDHQSSRERDRSEILHEDDLKQGKNLKLPGVFQELISRRAQGLEQSQNRARSQQKGPSLIHQIKAKIQPINCMNSARKADVGGDLSDIASPNYVKQFHTASQKPIARGFGYSNIKSADNGGLMKEELSSDDLDQFKPQQMDRLKESLIEVPPQVTIQRRPKTMSRQRRQAAQKQPPPPKQNARPFIYRNKDAQSPNQFQSLTPKVLSYAIPTSMEVSIKIKKQRTTPSMTEVSKISDTFKRVVLTKSTRRESFFNQQMHKSSLNKYGSVVGYQTAYPTPLSKYIQKAEDQKQMLLNLEKHLAKNPKLSQTVTIQSRQEIATNQSSIAACQIGN